jgi:hypothetical protein
MNNFENELPEKIFNNFEKLLEKFKIDILKFCINNSRSIYFLPKHIVILLYYYPNSDLIKELNLLYINDINKYNDFYEKVFLYPYCGSKIFKLKCNYFYNNIKYDNLINVLKNYKGNITNRNIYKIVAFGNILYDNIKKYYKKNICTQRELYIMITRFQLKHLVNIPSVAKTLYKTIIDSKFGTNSKTIILHDIICDVFNVNIKEFIWNPLTFFEIENLEVLLDNKVKITTEMMEIFINTIYYDKYKNEYYDSSYKYEYLQTFYKYQLDYNIYKIKFHNKYIKIIIDKCILSGAKLKYSSFINLLMCNIEYEDFHKYGIKIKDNISELFIDTPIPEFIVKNGISISDNTLLTYFTKNKNFSKNDKYMKKYSLQYSELCLKGIVTNCKKNNYTAINKLINVKGIKVTPDVIKTYITTNGYPLIGTLLWDEFNKSYDIIKKT